MYLSSSESIVIVKKQKFDKTGTFSWGFSYYLTLNLTSNSPGRGEEIMEVKMIWRSKGNIGLIYRRDKRSKNNIESDLFDHATPIQMFTRGTSS